MKHGGFWTTTVATGLMVAGLMTIGRAGLKSQGFLFLAGQLKIAAGDTDSGMKLLARAASGPDMSSNSMLSSEKESVIAEKKPCPKSMTAPAAPKMKITTVMPTYAPEPTMAMIQPNVPPPPQMLPTSMSFALPYIPVEQSEELRRQQNEIRKAHRLQERTTKKLLREVSLKYGQDSMPNADEIRSKIQREMGVWAQ